LQIELLILMMAASPFIECRGAIPLGLAYGVHPIKVFILALTGNLIPAFTLPVLLSILESHITKALPITKKFLDEARAKAYPYVSKYGFIGLAAFVAIPLPVSGAWTASAAAFALGFKLKKSILSISLGVLIAATLVELLSMRALGMLS